jgi:dihydrofolate synthase/folylpolyglutamate synthase
VVGTNGRVPLRDGRGAPCRRGLSTSLYTSPHLRDFTERIQVDGRAVSRGEFARAAQAAAEQLEGEPAPGFQTTFEHLTAMAFLVARERGVAAQVVEVGLGGRLDSTNVVTPRVTVITPVSLDHREVLGETLGAIATEKAGILKRGVPALLGRQAPAAERAIALRARRVGAPVESIVTLGIMAARATARGEAFSLRTPLATYEGLLCGLRGAHQVDNAALAIRAVELFLGRALAPAAVRRALRAVRWPGRF